MAFWSDSQLEPKRSFRFYVTFGGANLPHWLVKKVNRPTITVGEVKHQYLIHSYYYPGKVEWNTVKFTLVDPVDPDAATTMRTLLASAGYFHPRSNNTNAATLRTLGKGSSTAALGSVLIQQVNDAGVTVEKWELNNAWIKSVTFSELSYDTEELSNIELELRYDWATLNDLALSTA
jgi:hypothetical protein